MPVTRVAAFAAVVVATSGLGAAPSPSLVEVSRSRYLMGTVCEATLLVEEPDRHRAAAAIEAAMDEIARLESILSDWRADSELSRLNRAPAGEPFACSSDLFDFLRAGAALSRETSGAFDLTVGPLVRLYDLRGSGRWPTAEELEGAMQTVGSGRLSLDPEHRRATPGRPGMTLDPGGLGKGYALDAAAGVLRARGFPVALLDFGGQALALDPPPGEPGWSVALSHPRRRDEAALSLVLARASLATSGNVEHGLVVDGRPLGHLLDPLSGRPAPFRGSASIVAPTGARADAYSTALFVMGPERGLAWAAGRQGLIPIFLEEDSKGALIVRSGAGLDQLRAGAVRREPRPAGGF